MSNLSHLLITQPLKSFFDKLWRLCLGCCLRGGDISACHELREGFGRNIHFSVIGAILFALMVAVMIALPHLSGNAGSEGKLTMSLTGAIMAVVLGFIGAGTMIVPGISGSMVMLVLGYYNDIIGHITGLKEVVKGGFSGAAIPWGHVFALGFFAIGAVLGLLLVSRWIKWLLSHCPVPTYYAIMGLMLASPYPIFIKSGLDFAGMGVGHIIAGCVTLILGFALALFLDRQGEKAEKA